MFSKKQDTQNTKTDFSKPLRNIGGAQGLIAAYEHGERNFIGVNLENADLSQANLAGINLEKANLKGANLSQTNLSEANLAEANLRGANLTQTHLRCANLNGSDLRQAVIKQVDFYRANLSWANLSEQDLKGANLARVDLQGADLSAANLSEANLNEAKLDAANLKGAVLVRANLNYAYMPCAQLTQAVLTEAELASADLTAANLEKCILDRADMARVRLRKAQLQQASLQKTYLRDGNLQAANLTNASLLYADLTNTKLEEAILTQADLRGTEIGQAQQVNLELAILGELDKVIEHSLHLELKGTGKSFAFSFNGEMLAYTDWKQKITLINLNTKKQISQIEIQSEPVVSIVFSADGKKLHHSFYVNELKLWNPLTGELIQNLKNHSANFTSIVWDGNVKSFAITGTGEPFEVFNVGHETRTLKGYSSGILTQAHSPDGKFTARSSPDVDGQVELIDRQTGKLVYLLTGHKAPVQSLAFSPDSQTLASKNIEELKLWQVKTGKETYNRWQSCIINDHLTVAFTQRKDSSNPVLISSDFYIEFEEPEVVTSDRDDKVTLYGGNTSGCAPVTNLSADARVLARHHGYRPVQLWNLQTGEELGVVNLDADYGYPTLSSTGDILAARYKGKITLWDVKTNTIIYSYNAHSGNIQQIIFSPDDKIIASGGYEGTIKLWNLQTNCEVKTLQGYSSILALAFSPSEPILTSASRDGKIRLWDLEKMEEIHSFKSQQKIINLQFGQSLKKK
jgi:uncharacterized protein YjbI with pentapeptide repeats/WD40 repeat protein